MFVMQRFNNTPRVSQLGLAACLAVDAGCMAVTGVAGLFAFGFAWVVLKAGGVI